ncbi:hypothetical protein EKO27_g6682 [Xylaria grammica]|uniref:UDP-glucose 6-dehydrogenase n=1 Tax=Xylaria grammica TaxID=363999 RepID=A0A439D287_9PEZI|nr:hypothetical protein EKO27_g6682 [Xylaria grammica]
MPPAGHPDESMYQDMASSSPTTPDDHSFFSSAPRAERQVDHISPGYSSPSSQFADAHRSVRNICCVGAGYVGGPTATVIAYQNPHIRVTAVDRDAQRIRRWNSRHLPINEPGLRDMVRIARDGSKGFSSANEADGGSLDVETERCIAEADLVFIAVNTPTKGSGVGAGAATDMTAFEAAVCEIARHARAGTIVVEKSTVPCRTAQLVQDMLAAHRPGVRFDILSSPEFLAAGTAIQDLLRPDRVLIGSSPTPSGRRAADALADVYAAWVPRARIIGTNVWSAELAKVVANAMLAQRLSSINSISAICEATGADIDEVVAAVGSDARVGARFLKPGIGFGGSCLKKDVLSLVYLAESLGLGHVAEYWRHVVSMNEQQRDRFSRRVVRCLNNTLVGKKITILGFAFKANTSDVRESPTMDIIRTLRDENPLEIAIFDPCCNPAAVRQEIEATMKRDQNTWKANGCPVIIYSDVYEACAASNAILITTECYEFKITWQAYSIERESSKRFYPTLFARRKLTEMDIIALHESLLQLSKCEEGDPLRRFVEEPLCAEDCPDCELVGTRAGGYRAEADVDWRKISHHMKKPRWLFDGKGIIAPKEIASKMASLGIHVESIGRQGNL